ncbi:hypothetical protein predicted by Glimmer/Critica [Salmonella enterica subsp. enterica serovar Weltevreden str. 2007-60-3289-1]|nr:hypothetical protein predicted by Glimmer/Critica [Salmonella enterica subsp. enterica serovar Weltevreden str. 2007-60-3289-1]
MGTTIIDNGETHELF